MSWFFFVTEQDYDFNVELVKDGIIKDCLIVGENASGKTNLGYAIFDIIRSLTDKNRKEIKIYSNLYNADSIVEFKYTFRFGESVLRYSYERLSSNVILAERIFVNEKKVLENDFSGAKVSLKGTENLDLEKWDRSISLVKYVYANTILDKEDAVCNVFYQFMQFVNQMLWFSSTEGNKYMGFSNEKGDLLESIAGRDRSVEELQEFLRDLGIEYQLLIKDNGEGKNVYCRLGEKEVPLASLVSSGTRSVIFFSIGICSWKSVPFYMWMNLTLFIIPNWRKQLSERLFRFLVCRRLLHLIIQT